MVEQLITSTLIHTQEGLTAAELNKIINYCSGSSASLCIIQDNREFVYRDEIFSSLKDFRDFTILDRVFPNPKSEDIMQMVSDLKGKEPDVIIGIGGGSALDAAKAVAMVLSNGGDLDDYLGPEATRKVEKKKIKLILVPTTSGTGAEVTKFGVYSARSGRKYTLNNPLLQADIALVVSKFTESLPPALTAATGFDALSHALETLWNKNATETSDSAAIDAAVYILKWLETSYDSAVSGGLAGRQEMMLGALKAGISFNLTGTAAVHALSFILSEEWHIPHGASCAFTLEDIMVLNAVDESTKQKLINISKRLFDNVTDENAVEKLVDRIVFLKKKMNMPIKFSDLHITVTADEIPALFERSFTDPKMGNNIPKIPEEQMYSMLKGKI